MVEHKVVLVVKFNTKQRFQTILEYYKEQNPDTKVNQDFILRKLMDKYEGDSL